MPLYDLHNPTRAPRIIYDGIVPSHLLERLDYEPSANDMRCIRVEAGETVKGVALADHIAKRLQDYARRAEFSQELQIREHVEPELGDELGDEPAPPPPSNVWPDGA
jgi:hypothetical protein